jgi:ribose transport system permease protein
MNAAAVESAGKTQRRLTQSLIIIFLIIAICVFTAVVNPRFLRIQNIINIFQQISVLGIVACGIGMLLIAGQIDISVGSQISLMAVTLTLIIERLIGKPGPNVQAWQTAAAIPLAVFVVFALGFVMGLINGIVVIKSKAPSFIITLGFMAVYHGFALLVSGGTGYPMYEQLEGLGRGRIFGFVPIPILFFLGAVIIVFVVLKWFRYGRYLYAIGSSRKAAYVSGIQTDRTTLIAYIIVGLCTALATLLLISRIGWGRENVGIPYSFDALVAVIVGGVAITGGKGTALNIFLGVVLIGLIENALIIMNVNPHVRSVVMGLVIVIAVTMGQFSEAGVGYIRRKKEQKGK